MVRITLSIGFNDKDSGVQEIPTVAAMDVCADVLCDFVDGATIYNTRGIFKHANGMQVREEGIRVECFDPDEDALRKACHVLKDRLNQEAIYWTKEEIESEMI